MIWNTKIIESGTNNQSIDSEVEHTNETVVFDSIEETYDRNHAKLANWNDNSVGYVQGDLIFILNFESGSTSRNKSTIDLSKRYRDTDDPEQGDFLCIVPYDNRSGVKRVKGNGKRTNHKVVDEIKKK